MSLSPKHTKVLKKVIEAVTEIHPPADSRWKSRTIQALKTALADPDTAEADQYRNHAIRTRSVDGDLEIDTDAVVSMSDTGAYVQAWVWVGKEELDGR